MTRIVTKASAGKFAKVTRARGGALVKVGHIKGMSFKLVSAKKVPRSSGNGK
jgi:hypothetical protein